MSPLPLSPTVDGMSFLFLITILPALMGLLWGTPLMAADLTPYQWKNRLLLVFAPSPSDQRFAEFERSLMARSVDIQDRDLRVFRIFDTGPSYLDGQELPPEDAESLRRRFRQRAVGIRLILIGKDGGVKLTGEERIALQAVFDLIDQMPMRRQEIKAKGLSP